MSRQYHNCQSKQKAECCSPHFEFLHRSISSTRLEFNYCAVRNAAIARPGGRELDACVGRQKIHGRLVSRCIPEGANYIAQDLLRSTPGLHSSRDQEYDIGRARLGRQCRCSTFDLPSNIDVKLTGILPSARLWLPLIRDEPNLRERSRSGKQCDNI